MSISLLKMKTLYRIPSAVHGSGFAYSTPFKMSVDFSTYRNIIAGAPRTGKTVSHGIDPSTRKPLWDIPVASAQDLDDAVTSAQAAFPKWSQTSWKQRQACLRQARALLQENRESMAKLISSEGGKPPQFADLEVAHGLRYIDYYGKVHCSPTFCTGLKQSSRYGRTNA